MQLRLEQLSAHLAKGAFARTYLIHGDEPLLQIEAADMIRAAAMQAGYSERELWIVETHFKWDQLSANQDNFSLFATKKLTEIRVPSGKVGVEGGQHMLALAERASEDTILLASFPKLERAQTQSAWFNAWNNQGMIVEAFPVERERMAVWLAQRLSAQEQKADPEALTFLVEFCEGNLIAASQEVKKLALVCPKPHLTLADVEGAVTNVARYTLPALCESFLRGELARFTTVLSGLREEGMAAPRIIWQLNDCVHSLARSMTFSRGGKVAAAQAIRQAQVWWNKEAVEYALTRVNPRRIAPCVQTLSEIDAMSKGLRGNTQQTWPHMVRLAQQLYES